MQNDLERDEDLKILKHHMENGNLQYYVKPTKWINANEYPDDQAEIDYWIGVAKAFPDVSLDFLCNDNYIIDVVSESETNLESNKYTEKIGGIDEVINISADKKDPILFIPEKNSSKKISKFIQTPNSKNPSIFLQYNYEKPEMDSIDSQSEFDDSDDSSEKDQFFEIDKSIKSENDDILQVLLPTYSIEKHIYNEKTELISLDDIKYAEIAEGVSKRCISHVRKDFTSNFSPKNVKESKTKSAKKKIIQVSTKYTNSITQNANLNTGNQLSNNINISIKKCFMIDEILFFIVETNPKNEIKSSIEYKDSQEICLPESIMKKHFPDVLIEYYEKCIVFNE